MENSKTYLKNKGCITEGDVVFMDIIDLLQYTKIVQLETMLDFLETNEPTAYGMINTIKFELRAIMKNSQHNVNNSLNY